MDDDSMDIDDTAPDTRIILRKESGIEIIGENVTEPAKKSEEIVLLDDDDDETTSISIAPTPVAVHPPPSSKVEVIDLVDQSANSKCINYECKDGKNMLIAPNLCLSYYRVKNVIAGTKEVCTSCYDESIKRYDMLTSSLLNGELLCELNLPIRNDTVEIADSDDENEPNRESLPIIEGENLKLIEDNFEAILSETMRRVNFESHTKLEVENLQMRQKKSTNDLEELQKQIDALRKSLDSSQINTYRPFRRASVQDPEITIIHDVNGLNLMESFTAGGKRKSLRNASKNISYVEMENPNSPQAIDNDENITKDIPKIGVLEPPKIEINEIYLIPKENQTGSWIKARLKELTAGEAQSKSRYNLIELKQQKERQVDGKNIASMTPSKVRLETGKRVVAIFKEITTTPDANKPRSGPYYPGVVAEPPVASNRYRYLIFFDIGYSQYVSHNSVFVVFDSSPSVWEDMHEKSRPFIRKYLESQDRPMVKLSRGQTVRTEYNGKWVLCTIKLVDCSLVLVNFDSLNRMEWIYRGSTRLSPMFKEEQNAAKRHTGGRTSNNRRQDPNESATIVQYTKNADFDRLNVITDTPPPLARAVARKSTTRPVSQQNNFVPFLPPVTNNSVVPIEPTSKIMYFTPRDQVITQRLYRPHNCTPACKDYVRHSLNKLKGHNPLSKPLLSGWARVTVKMKYRKEIMYKAPCSRMLRNIEEVHRYLRLTKSDMTVDLFDFNTLVRCLAEFCVECTPNPADLSNGLEQVPIPVINGINSDTLEFCNYLTTREPMEDVTVNTDPDFLCGCDCEDDCADKLKCACWRLTLEGSKYMGKNIDPKSIGYVYRRLHEPVLTGIYECNSRCKCQSTCLNRVVQNPMSVKLQVFRTHNRGWGIRCVNDIPQGSFICIYAGTMHTEQMANKDGITHGDEYFAELDYIENCEKHKEDYESDVNSPSTPRSGRSMSPDDDDDTVKRRRYRTSANKDNDFNPGGQNTSVDIENAMKLRKRNQDDTVVITPSEIETVTISDDDDDPKEVLNFNPENGSDLDDNKSDLPSVRRFFDEDEPYIMDTKNAGNIGRFLNHSCLPNVFVQNVFVDTHDVRFPWVAFFCSQYIRAGTELTWNYNYDIGSVPGRVLYCHCGSLECKGRLL